MKLKTIAMAVAAVLAAPLKAYHDERLAFYAIKTETLPHNEGFIRSEANGMRSRENVTLASGNNLKAGTILGLHASTGKYSIVDINGSNGLETSKAILLSDADASGGDLRVAVLARDAEVQKAELTYAAGASAAQKTTFDADLLAVGIIVRAGPDQIETQTT